MAPAAMFAGSRALPAPGSAVVAQVTAAAIRAGRSVVTGCAVGADQSALSAALANPSASVHVFAVGGASGVGFAGTASAWPVVMSAPRSGAVVHWRAGGSLALPLRARLARRSLAAVQFTAAQGQGSLLAAFPSALPPRQWHGSGSWRSCGSGTWSSVAAAALLGLPVVVFPVGALAGSPLPALPVAGSWQQCSRSGLWSQGFIFAPATPGGHKR